MNPRSNATVKEKVEHRLTPFEQITEAEGQQEARAQEVLLGIEKETQEMEREWKNKEREEEEALRTQARAELKEFAKSEPAAILSRSEEEAQAELKAIDAEYQKHAPTLSKALVESIVDFSFLSHS